MLARLVIEMCWHLLKELLKSVGKLKNVLVFPEGAFKKMLASLEKCWHMLMELLKSVCKLRRVLAFPEGAVKKVVKCIALYM